MRRATRLLAGPAVRASYEPPDLALAADMVAAGVKEAPESDDVKITSAGVYLHPNRKDLLPAVVRFLQRHPAVGSTFTRRPVEGGLPISLVAGEHERTPDLLFARRRRPDPHRRRRPLPPVRPDRHRRRRLLPRPRRRWFPVAAGTRLTATQRGARPPPGPPAPGCARAPRSALLCGPDTLGCLQNADSVILLRFIVARPAEMRIDRGRSSFRLDRGPCRTQEKHYDTPGNHPDGPAGGSA